VLIMSCCGSSSPLLQYIKSQSPQELLQAKLNPKNPLDPKTLLALQNPTDPSLAANSSAPASGAKAPGTGTVIDIKV
jgi:hypothetical protein